MRISDWSSDVCSSYLHVVAHVVSDRRGVAGVVLGDAGFDLADEVGADVGGLGVDAAAYAGEQRDGAGAEPKRGEDAERVVDLEQIVRAPCRERAGRIVR